MRFKKNQKIKTEGKTYQCVCKDTEIAIFAPVRGIRNEGHRVVFKGMFAVDSSISKAKSYGFEFKFVK